MEIETSKYPKLNEDIDFYRGKYVELSHDGRVFACDEDIDTVKKKAKELGVFDFTVLMRIPELTTTYDSMGNGNEVIFCPTMTSISRNHSTTK